MESSEIRNVDKKRDLNELFDVIDTDDIKKTIGGEKIIEGIKKEHQYTFMVRSDDVYKIFDHKSIKFVGINEICECPSPGHAYIFDLHKYNLNYKIIKSIKVTLQSACDNDGIPLISQQIVDKKIKKSMYTIEIGSMVIFKQYFVNANEIIPKNVLLMNNLNEYQSTNLVIRNFDDELHDISKLLIFNIAITYVELYEKVNSLCVSDNRIEFPLENNMGEGTKLIYVDYKGIPEYENAKIITDPLDEKTSSVDLEKYFRGIAYNKTTIGNIKGFVVNGIDRNVCDDDSEASASLKLLVGINPNFVTYSCQTKKTNNHSYITSEKNKMINVLSSLVPKQGDLIGNIKIFFNKQLDFNNLKIFYCRSEKKKIKYDILSTTTIVEPNMCYNMLCMENRNFEINFEIEYTRDDINTMSDPFDGLVISYDYILLQSKQRKQLADMSEILSTEDFEHLFD